MALGYNAEEFVFADTGKSVAEELGGKKNAAEDFVFADTGLTVDQDKEIAGLDYAGLRQKAAKLLADGETTDTPIYKALQNRAVAIRQAGAAEIEAGKAAATEKYGSFLGPRVFNAQRGLKLVKDALPGPGQVAGFGKYMAESAGMLGGAVNEVATNDGTERGNVAMDMLYAGALSNSVESINAAKRAGENLKDELVGQPTDAPTLAARFDKDVTEDRKVIDYATGKTMAESRGKSLAKFNQGVDVYEEIDRQKEKGAGFDPEVTQQLGAWTDLTELGTGVLGGVAGMAVKGSKVLDKLEDATSKAANLGSKVDAAAIAKTATPAGQGLAQAVGKTVEKTGSLVTKVTDGAIVPATIGFLASGGDPVTTMLSAAAGRVLSSKGAAATVVSKKTGGVLTGAGKKLQDPTTVLGAFNTAFSDVLTSTAKGAVAGTAGGALLATSGQSDEERKQLLATGIAMGGLGGAAGRATEILNPFSKWSEATRINIQENKIARPAVPVYGTAFDRVNAAGRATLSNRGAAQVDAIERLTQSILPDGHTSEMYVVKDKATADKMATEMGISGGGTANGFYGKVVDPIKGTRHISVVNLEVSPDGAAVGHEPGHVVWNVLPDETKAEIGKTIIDRFSADELRGFAENYEKAGLISITARNPDGSIDLANSPKLYEELFAEHMSAYMAGIPLGAYGGSREIGGKITQFFGNALERIRNTDRARKLGLENDLSATRARGDFATELGVEPSYTVKGIIGSIFAAGKLDASVPAGAPVPPPAGTPPAPVPPAPAPAPAPVPTPPIVEPAPVPTLDPEAVEPTTPVKPVEPIRRTQRPTGAAEINRAIAPETLPPDAEAVIREQPNADVMRETYLEINRQLSAGRGNSKPIRIRYRTAEADGGVVNLTTREGEQIRRDAGEQAEVVVDKVIVPMGAPTVTKNGSILFTALDVERVGENAGHLRKWISEHPEAGLTDPTNGADLTELLSQYSSNHANGYLGDGRPYPAQFQKRDGVTPNPDFSPYPIDPETVYFLNATMGATPPTKLTPVLANAVDVAKASGVPTAEFGDKGAVDTNKYRAAVRKAGDDMAIVYGGDRPGSSRGIANPFLRLDRVEGLESVPDTGARPINQLAVNAGLQPARKTAQSDRSSKKPVSSGMFAKSPAGFRTLSDKLTEIRDSLFSGGTFNLDGSLYSSPETPVIVTLGSKDFNAKTVDASDLKAYFDDNEALLSMPGVKAGIFRYESGGKQLISADLNVVLPRGSLELAKDFAKDNGQHSIFVWNEEQTGGDVIEVGGDGKTILKTAEEFVEAAHQLETGRYRNISELQRKASARVIAKTLPDGSLEGSVGKGPIKLIHYSGADIKGNLDPAKQGSGRATRNDKRGGFASYFFVEGTNVIDVDLGDRVYSASVDGGKIYDMGPDIKNLASVADHWSRNEGLKAAGFEGMLFDRDSTGKRPEKIIVKFTPTPVKFTGYTPAERTKAVPGQKAPVSAGSLGKAQKAALQPARAGELLAAAVEPADEYKAKALLDPLLVKPLTERPEPTDPDFARLMKGELRAQRLGSVAIRTGEEVLPGFEEFSRLTDPEIIAEAELEAASEDGEAEGRAPAPKVYLIAKALAERSRRIRRLPHDSRTKAALEAIAQALYEEIKHAITLDGNAIGWYDRKITEALDIIGEVHPEVATDPNHNLVFTTILAITSNGQNVVDNFIRADELYTSWKDTGSINSSADWGGARKNAINGSLALVDEMLKKWGPEKTREFLLKKYRVGDLKKIAKAELGIDIPGGESVDHLVHGSFVFGPKIGGGFFPNLQKQFDPITMDLWLMRTWNRINGSYGLQDSEKMALALSQLRDAARENPKLPDSAKVLEMTDGKLANWARARYQNWKTKRQFKDPDALDRPAKRFVLAKEGVKEAPRNGGERAWIRKVFGEIDKLLAKDGIVINNADKQAVLWYYEKDLYKSLGYKDAKGAPADYADGAREVLRRTASGVTKRK
jgi:hypothetical protein